jgi:hypothetical protein
VVGNFRSGPCSVSFDAAGRGLVRRHNAAAVFADCARNVLRFVDTGRSVTDLEGNIRTLKRSSRHSCFFSLSCSLEKRLGYQGQWSKWVRAVTLAATPMFGVVFGRTNAVAPGCEISLTWKRLNGRWDFTTYVFNVGLGAPSVVLGLAYSFQLMRGGGFLVNNVAREHGHSPYSPHGCAVLPFTDRPLNVEGASMCAVSGPKNISSGCPPEEPQTQGGANVERH